MYLHLLIGPMVLGAQSDMVAILHAAKGSLYVVLAAVAADYLYVSPLIVVRKKDRFTKQSFLQPNPGTIIESVAQQRQSLRLINLNLKQLLHMPSFEPAIDFFGDTFHRRPTASVNLPFPVTAELMLEIAQKSLTFGDFSQQGSGLGHEKVLVVSDQDGTLHFEHLLLAAVSPYCGQPLLIKGLKLMGRNRQQARLCSRRDWPPV